MKNFSRENLCAILVNYASHIVCYHGLEKAKHESMKLRIAERVVR
jgi:hypothetical protein